MKRVLAFALLLSSFTLWSQQEFTIKPALGINGCQIHGDNYDGYDKFGLFIGPAVNAKIGKRSSLELGFYFSQKGSKHNPDQEHGDYTLYRINLNYIDMPLSFRGEVVKGKYFFTLGPSIAYLINFSEKDQNGVYANPQPFKKYEVGVNAGIGANFSPRWSLEFRTSNSILPVRPWAGPNPPQYTFYYNWLGTKFNKGLYNNVLTLFLAYKFDLKKKHEE